MFESLGAFAAGVAVGWAGRSIAGSTREALVRIIVAGHKARDEARRALGERVEWLEDLLAEGRMRYDEAQGGAEIDETERPVVRRARDEAA